MKSGQLRVLGLQLRLALRRFGGHNVVAALVFISGAATWLWGLPYYQEKLEAQAQRLARLQHQLESLNQRPLETQQPTAEKHLADFHAVLGSQKMLEQQLRGIFGVARKAGLSLNQAEYKQAFNDNGNYRTYQILLPIKGAYPLIRQFCEQVLYAIPFASLDEITVKREAIAEQTPEARLRFTLYLSARSEDETGASLGSDLGAAVR